MEEKNNSFSFFQVFVSHYIRKNVVIPIVIAIRVAMNSATSSVILGYRAGKWKKQLILKHFQIKNNINFSGFASTKSVTIVEVKKIVEGIMKFV